jgi:NADH:ubiquinone oxidoreductase subunit
MASVPRTSQMKLSFGSFLSQISTRLMTAMTGVLVGEDALGTRYFREKKTPKGLRERRWAIFAGEPEASLITPEWHGWMHHTAPAPVPMSARKPWQLPFRGNVSGTRDAVFPPGHVLGKGARAKATGDYQPWTPAE